MIDITVTPSLRELERLLGPKFARQAKFALARSLTLTVDDARKRLRGALPAYFTVRSHFVASTIMTDHATKARLVAEVGSIQRAGSSLDMSLHATGGVKRGRTGKDLGVPVGARPTPSAKTTKAKFPGAMMKKRKYFRQVVNGRPGIWRRMGKKRYPIRLMWLLQPSVKISKDWPFEAQVQRAVFLVWAKNLKRSLDSALKTAR